MAVWLYGCMAYFPEELMVVILPANQGESRVNGPGIILHGNYMIGTIFMWIIFNLLIYHYLPRNWWTLYFVKWDHDRDFTVQQSISSK